MLGYDSLATIRTQIQRLVYNTTSTSNSTLDDAVNRELQQAAALHQWPQLLRVDKSGLRDPSDSNLKTLEAADEYAPLPVASARLLSLNHQAGVSGRTALEAVDPQRFSETVGNRTAQTGVPMIYRYVGQTAQIRKAAAGVATATCSVSGNDNVREVVIRFRKATDSQIGDPKKAVLSGAFSTGVSTSVSIAAGYSIEDVLIPSGWVGSFTLTDSAGTAIVKFQHYEEPVTATTTDKASLARQLIEVWPIPEADYPLTAHWYQDPRPLTADEDTPQIPVSAYLVDKVAAVLLEQAGRHKDARARMGSAMMHLRAITGLHRQDAPRIARPYGGNLLGATGVDY